MQSRIFKRSRHAVRSCESRKSKICCTNEETDRDRSNKNGSESWCIKKKKKKGEEELKPHSEIVLTQKNIVNISAVDTSPMSQVRRGLPRIGPRKKGTKSGTGGRGGDTGRGGLDCMVITINNGNLVCKWLETPGRTVPTYNFPPFCGRKALALSRAVSHIEMPWINICLRSRKLILFKSQVRG